MNSSSSNSSSSSFNCCRQDETSSSSTSCINEVEVDMSHFTKPKEILGIGGFGMVRRVTKITGYDSGKDYALKSMAKGMVLSRHSGCAAVMAELRALVILDDCDYICRIHYAYQDKSHLYMVLDYAAGGDMRYNLRKAPNFKYSENFARLVIHQVFLALDHCHRCSILHRGKC